MRGNRLEEAQVDATPHKSNAVMRATQLHPLKTCYPRTHGTLRDNYPLNFWG